MPKISEELRQRYRARLMERATRMRHQLLNEMWPELQIECHQLSGSAGSYGFGELSKLAAVAEDTIGSRSLAGASRARPAVEAVLVELETVLEKQE